MARLPDESEEAPVTSEQQRPNPIVEPANERPTDDGAPYSIFTPLEKKIIVLTASLSAVFSPMSTTIYLPALNALAMGLHVSSAKINLTVTTFLVGLQLSCQG